jgi:hypothetical protein
MAKILIHVTRRLEDPTRAALPFLVAAQPSRLVQLLVDHERALTY